MAEEQNKRPIDKMVEENYTWWSKSFVFIKKTRLKTWQGIFIIAFTAGASAMLMWSSYNDWHLFSQAAKKNDVRIPDNSCVAIPQGGSFAGATQIKVVCGKNVIIAYYLWEGETPVQIMSSSGQLWTNTVYDASQDKSLKLFGKYKVRKKIGNFSQSYQFKSENPWPYPYPYPYNSFSQTIRKLFKYRETDAENPYKTELLTFSEVVTFITDKLTR